MIWSFSSSNLFRRCQRQWYYKTHVANSRATKIPLQREIYLLSKLQSVAAWRGSVVDHVISRRIVPALSNKWPVSTSKTLDYARSVFTAQLAFAKEHRVREPGMSPTKAADNFAALYPIEFGLEVSDQECDAAWKDVEQALRNLLGAQKLLGYLSTATKLIPQRPLTFPFFGVTVRAVPDLIAFFKSQTPVIVDWKVHSFGVMDYRLQLATYAVALSRCEPHKDFPACGPMAPTSIRLLEFQLLTNKPRQYRLDETDIEEIDSYIAHSATEMSLADGDASKGIPLPLEYPAAQFAEACKTCSFRTPCWEVQSCQESSPMFFQSLI